MIREILSQLSGEKLKNIQEKNLQSTKCFKVLVCGSKYINNLNQRLKICIKYDILTLI